jgi:PAS domain S-box-containing protein
MGKRELTNQQLAAENDHLKVRIAVLQAMEQRFGAILHSISDGVVTTDVFGKVQQMNPVAEALTGWSETEARGRPANDILKIVNEETRNPVESPIDRVVREGTVTGLANRKLLISRDGTERPIADSVAPVRDRAGRVLGTVRVFRDQTRERQAEQAVEKLNEDLKCRGAELEAVNKELEAFSYSVSHDLRAPLRAMDGFSQALVEDCGAKLDDHGRDYLGRVRAASQRMAQLIDDLLNLSRVGRTEMHPGEVDLSALAGEIAEDLRKAEPSRQVEMVIAKDLKASGDARLLRVVLVNLLGNAWKFTRKKPRARIEFGIADCGTGIVEPAAGQSAIRNPQSEIVFMVRDDGAGFDMSYANKLFGAFQRLHSSQEFEGTGIGLATVQRIIRRHGGKVWAEGAVGKGATFYFTLG